MSFKDSDLAQVSLNAQSGTLSLDEVRAQVAETVKSAQARGNKAPLPLPPQLLLMRTSRAGLDAAEAGLAYATLGISNSNSPFSSIEVRMVPENVTLARKSITPQADAAHPAPATERLIVVRHGEGLDDILGAAGVGKDVTKAIKETFRVNRNGDPAIEGRRIRLSFAETVVGDGLELARVSIYENDDLKAAVALADDGRYLLLEDAPTAEKRTKKPASEDDTDELDEDSGGMRLYNSLYETALKQDIPRPVIDQMVRTFNNDVDFQRW